MHLFKPKRRHAPVLPATSVNKPAKQKISVWRYAILLPAITIPLILFTIFHVPFLKISHITMTDAVDTALTADINSLKGQNLLFLNTNTVAKNLMQKYPSVGSIALTKRFPSTLQVQLVPRMPIASLNFVHFDDFSATASATLSAQLHFTIMAPAYLIDKDLVIYAKSESFDTLPATGSSGVVSQNQLPRILDGEPPVHFGQKVQSNAMRAARDLILLEQLMHPSIAQYVVTPRSDILATLPNDTITVHFGVDQDPKIELAALQTILNSTTIERKKLTSIDLRFDRPTITYK